MLAPGETPEAGWIWSTMPLVGLSVTSSNLTSWKSGHALCALQKAWKSLSLLMDFNLKGKRNVMKKRKKSAVLVKPCSTYIFMGAGEESFPERPGCNGQCTESREWSPPGDRPSPGFGQSSYLEHAQVTHPKGFVK